MIKILICFTIDPLECLPKSLYKQSLISDKNIDGRETNLLFFCLEITSVYACFTGIFAFGSRCVFPLKSFLPLRII